MVDGKNRIFISWSGELSKAVGHHLESFFPTVIQSLEPWMSATDILQGGFWHQEIMHGLEGAKIGVVVLTKENVLKPWLHYEVGYLTRFINQDEGLVAPILVDVSTSQIEGPMTSLQATAFEQEPMLKLVKDINKMIGQPTSDAVIESIFAFLWQDLKDKIDQAVATHRPKVSLNKPFDNEKVLTEILTSVRQLAARSVDPDLLLDTLNRLDVQERQNSSIKTNYLKRETERLAGQSEAARLLEEIGSRSINEARNLDWDKEAIERLNAQANAASRNSTAKKRSAGQSGYSQVERLAELLAKRSGVSIVGFRRSQDGEFEEVLVAHDTSDQDVSGLRDALSQAAQTDISVQRAKER